MCKYHLNHLERGIVCSDTGEIVRPSCWVDLVPYYSYLVGLKGHKKDANCLLKRVFKGEKVISDMIIASHQLHR